MRWTLFASILCSNLAPAQAGGDQPWRDKLARAVVIEEHEHDPARAALAYREVVAGARGDLRAEASLRLGAALMAIGKRDEAQVAVAEALAAGGTLAARAQAVLDGQDQADKFLAKRVEAALATLRKDVAKGQQELFFLGKPVVPLLVARLRADFASGAADKEFSGGLVVVLCVLGGKPAGDYLSEVAASSDLFARRLVADAVNRTDDVPQFDGDVLGALERFTNDAEPAIRASITSKVGHRLPLARVIELCADVDAFVRQTAIRILGVHINAIPAGSPCPEVVLTTVRRAFDDASPGVRATVGYCLNVLTRHAAGRRLAIAAVAHPTLGYDMSQGGMLVEAPNEHAEELAAAAQAMASRGEKLDRLRGVIKLALASGAWNGDAWPQVLAITDAGYRDSGAWLVAHMGNDPARVVQVIERLNKVGSGHVFESLRKLSLPKEAFVALEAWQDGDPKQRHKALLMTKLDDDRAVAWFAKAAAAKSIPVTEVIDELLRSRPASASRDAVLLELALHPEAGDRSQSAIVELIRAGNEPGIALVGRAYERGLQVLYMEWRVIPEAALARAVDLALGSGQAQAFADVALALSNPSLLPGSAPPALVEAILRHAANCPISKQRNGEPLPEGFFRSLFRWSSLSPAQRTDLAIRLAAKPEFLDPLVQALASNPVELPRDLIPTLRARLDGEAGQDHRATNYLTVIARIGGPTIPGLLRELLRHPSPHVRHAAATNLAKVDESAAADLVAIGDDPSAMVRWALVRVANDLPDPRFVPGLLRLMRTATGERDQVQKAIELIDFHANQTARWKRMLEGQGLDAPSAAEALVKQAKPGNEPAVRVAAIASLGTLKVPETLPVLVDLLRDADPAIQAAAQAAITKINGGR